MRSWCSASFSLSHFPKWSCWIFHSERLHVFFCFVLLLFVFSCFTVIAFELCSRGLYCTVSLSVSGWIECRALPVHTLTCKLWFPFLFHSRNHSPGRAQTGTEEVLQTEVSAPQLCSPRHFYLNRPGSFNPVISYKEILQAMMKHKIQVHIFMQYCLALPDCAPDSLFGLQITLSVERRNTLVVWFCQAQEPRVTIWPNSVAKCPCRYAGNNGLNLTTVTKVISPILFMINKMSYRFVCIKRFRGQCFARSVY